MTINCKRAVSLCAATLIGVATLTGTLFPEFAMAAMAGRSAQQTDITPDAAQDLAATPEEKSDGDEAAEPREEYPLAELPPLRRLVLYNSGVGQLQHEGQVEGKTRFEIRFSAHDVDDVLKSLVFADEGGGLVRAVEYQPAPEPEDVAANTVGMPMTLAQLIQRFRGESVTLTVGGSTLTGTVYGVENRTEGDVVLETVVLLTDEGLQSVALPRVDRVRFEQEELRKTIRQAMQGIVKSRKANEKKLELLFDGEGKRNVRFAYVVDMPIWRMTYRLSIEEGKVYLQGWAHVDNVTGVDWEQVVMELRSGKPQSFHVNIFAPLMAERPDFGDAVYEFTNGLILVTQWFGFEPASRFGQDAGRSAAGGGGFGGGGGGGFFGGGGRGGGGSAGPRAGGGIDIESAFRQAAQGSRTAQMVRYQLDKPVDLGAGRSAALPVFANEVPAKLISVFDENEEGAAPFRAVEITNNSSLSVVSGPVSIMRDGDFVGDGKLGRLDVDEKTEIVYGVDRAVEIRVRGEQPRKKLVKAELDEKRGIVLYYQSVRRTIFGINNRDTEARDLVLYCEAAEDEKVTQVPEPERRVDGRARYVTRVEARSAQEFEVSYSSQNEERMTLNGASASALELRDKKEVEVAEEVLQLLDRLIELDAALVEAREKSSELADLKTSLGAEQTRVRENLKVLGVDQEAARPFLEKLQSLEERIEEINGQRASLHEELEALARQQQQAVAEYFDQ